MVVAVRSSDPIGAALFCPSSVKPPKYDNVNHSSTECGALSDNFLRDMPEDSQPRYVITLTA